MRSSTPSQNLWRQAGAQRASGPRAWMARAILFAMVATLAPAMAVAQAPADGASADGDATADTGYKMRLRELQNRVVALKEEIFRTKTRLTLIKERLLSNVISESKLFLVHKNKLSGSFAIEEIIYYLDDNKIYYGDAESVKKGAKEFNFFEGNAVPGHHVLAVEVVLKGESALFSYVDDFRFRVRSSHTFFAPKGRITNLRAVLYERGGMLSDFRDRPAVKFEVEQVPYTRENLKKFSSAKK